MSGLGVVPHWVMPNPLHGMSTMHVEVMKKSMRTSLSGCFMMWLQVAHMHMEARVHTFTYVSAGVRDDSVSNAIHC